MDRGQPLTVSEFWELARVAAHLNPMPGYFPEVLAGTLPPPAWAFGDSPELADELVELVERGVKTATSTAMAEFEAAGEPVPEVGDLSIVLDGRGHPRVLLRTTEVAVAPFDQVDADHAAAEGEGDGSLENWRVEHRKYFSRTGAFADDMAVVLERFEVLYQV